MEKYIYTKKNSIPKELCDDIINYYNSETRYPGISLVGYNPNIKNTTDFIIPLNDTKWEGIINLLHTELDKNLKKYFENITNNISSYSNNYENNFGIKYSNFNNSYFFQNVFMIQKYYKNIGNYKYHNDYNIHKNDTTYNSNKLIHRIVTYLWYLNDVEDGGETGLWYGKNGIKPEKGKLLLFPGHAGFIHAGLIPRSDDKYIITGWLYQEID